MYRQSNARLECSTCRNPKLALKGHAVPPCKSYIASSLIILARETLTDCYLSNKQLDLSEVQSRVTYLIQAVRESLNCKSMDSAGSKGECVLYPGLRKIVREKEVYKAGY